MKLFFPHYKELSTKQTLKERHFEIVRALMCEKLISINNNPQLTPAMIEEHLHLIPDETSFYENEKTKDCITITFKFNLFELFECEFELPIYVHYDENGRQTHYSSFYKGETFESNLIDHLNLNHFNDDAMQLEFYLQQDFGGSAYALTRKNCFKTPTTPENIKNHIHFSNSTTYFFDKSHSLCRKTFETKKFGNACGVSYYLDDYGDIETELLLIKFVKHIYNIKAEVDTSFFDYASIDCNDAYWFKTVNKSFYANWYGKNRAAFMDYLTLVEMLEI